MSKGVVIKSNRYGINLILDNLMPFPELLQMISDKFKEVGDFFKDSKMAIAFENRILTIEEEQQILDVISTYTSIQIVSIIDNDSKLEEEMRKRVEAHAEAEQTKAEKAENGSDFYKGNLRSGQVLESTSNVIIIGDVNPGAKVITMGNIIVLGSLKGNAYAGVDGNSSCFIYALEMKPIQLQIGDFIAKSPDKEKGRKRLRKKDKNQADNYFSQIATAKDGNICIEPMIKGCLNNL